MNGPKLTPTSLRKDMNQFNTLHGKEQNEPPRDWNSQPPESHFKYRTSPTNTSPVVSYIMGRPNHHAIDNGDVGVYPSEFPVEFNSESVPDPETRNGHKADACIICGLKFLSPSLRRKINNFNALHGEEPN